MVCKDCGKDFIFTAGEQEFYAEKGFQNEPTRCKDCRDSKKAALRKERTYYDATCAECGEITKVPFQPSQGRPVYCSKCYASHK